MFIYTYLEFICSISILVYSLLSIREYLLNWFDYFALTFAVKSLLALSKYSNIILIGVHFYKFHIVDIVNVPI